ncbi:MAG TPA: hypothetical protein VNY83_04915 [Solirubrobacterales bacterium]|jgi:hypothetical protein|nr:hypothetical protein [Solirubrobacterales bacterium]
MVSTAEQASDAITRLELHLRQQPLFREGLLRMSRPVTALPRPSTGLRNVSDRLDPSLPGGPR